MPCSLAAASAAAAGTWLLADNVVYPGAPDLLAHLAAAPQDGAAPARYVSTLLPAPYEYEQKWLPGWEPKDDALAAAIFVEGLGPEARAGAQARLQRVCKAPRGCRPLPGAQGL